MRKSAQISDCGMYRYELSRVWDDTLPSIAFIGLNPSTADAETDDPTIRRCIGFAKSWGYGGLFMLNLFAYRATNPVDMMWCDFNPIGRLNDMYLREAAHRHRTIVAAWGTLGKHMGRDKEVMSIFDELMCLRKTAKGHPEHPLYLPKKLKLIPFNS